MYSANRRTSTLPIALLFLALLAYSAIGLTLETVPLAPASPAPGALPASAGAMPDAGLPAPPAGAAPVPDTGP